MKGKILGSDASGGTISGEDGKRYKFDTFEWKSARAPMPGEEVDYDLGADGKAHDIFSLKTGATIDFGAVGGQARALLGEGTSSPLGARLLELVTGNPLFQISLVILVASFFLTFIKITMPLFSGASDAFPDRGIYKLVNTNDLVDYIKTSLDAGASLMDQAAQAASSDPGSAAGLVSAAVGDPKDDAEAMRFISGAMNLFYLVYLIPVGATAIIVQLARAKSVSLIALGTGLASIVSLVLMFVARSRLVSVIGKMGNTDAAALTGKAFAFGLGFYVILLCGAGLIGFALGLVRLPRRA